MTISAPTGVPANAILAGSAPHSGTTNPKAPNPTSVASKPPAGTTFTASLAMPAGTYKVGLPDVQWEGVRYIGTGSRPEVVVKSGASTSLTVTYAPDGAARNLHLTDRSATSLSFGWEGPSNAQYRLNRAEGPTPPARFSDGQPVGVQGTTAVDTDLTPGTVYSYSLFTRTKDTWAGPLTTSSSIGTAGSTQATYATAPTTLLAAAADVVAVRGLGDGLEVTFSPSARVPLVGAAVAIPVLPGLDGGYLGTVTRLSGDGRTATLAPDGLAAAFDYYELDVEDLSTVPAGAEPAPPAAAKSSAPTLAPAPPLGPKPADPAEWPAYRAEQSKTLDAAAGGSATRAPGLSASKQTASPSTQALLAANECGVSVPELGNVSFNPSLTPSGFFRTKVNKWGPVPKSAEVDLGFRLTATGALSAEVSAAFACGLKLPEGMRMITTNPIPIAVKWELTAEVSISGAVNVANVGVTATVGLEAHASMSAKGVNASGDKFLSAEPLSPKMQSGSVDIGATIGGAITIGPGAGTKEAGVIAGIRVETNLLDLTVSIRPPVNQAFCVSYDAGATLDALLTARAWLGPWSTSADAPIIEGTWHFPGSPWDFPKGCTKASPPTPDDVIGPGVTKGPESAVGAPGQQGYSDGLIPGQKTWVLSTGLIADAEGSPASIASTNLGTAGDSDLTTKSGYPTQDAASYEVTVVPSGSTLHVKYLFASEEYLEWVGSQFNDVMAVYVNGQNCAVVPGTTTPVSVNTINATTNSTHFVDNAAGAAGYNTTFDGLTLPLTCDVAVTPGQPVVIKIAVADGSDHVLDSAVALVQQGIWSD